MKLFQLSPPFLFFSSLLFNNIELWLKSYTAITDLCFELTVKKMTASLKRRLILGQLYKDERPIIKHSQRYRKLQSCRLFSLPSLSRLCVRVRVCLFIRLRTCKTDFPRYPRPVF